MSAAAQSTAPALARDALLRLNKYRPRSVAETRQRLEQKGFSAQVVEEATAWALACGALDDAKFACLWVDDRLQRRPASAQYLRFELRQKGVDDADIQAALDGAALDERKILRELVEKRLPRYRGLSPERRQRRLVSFLLNRGFAFNDVFAALKEMRLIAW